MIENVRNKLVMAMYEHEKTIGKIELIILSKVFYKELKKECMSPKLLDKKKTIYEIPYIINGRKEGFTIK